VRFEVDVSDICKEGDVADRIYFILRGNAELSKHMERDAKIRSEGKRRIVSLVGEGDVVGDVGLLLGGAHATTATATKEVAALTMRWGWGGGY
jgi:CRP-like cAMP-binding protein